MKQSSYIKKIWIIGIIISCIQLSFINVNASNWLNGSGIPSSLIGASGDYYLMNSTGDVYYKATDTWAKISNIKGPQGIKGDTGLQGIQGNRGAQGYSGTTGAKGNTGAAGPNSVSTLTSSAIGGILIGKGGHVGAAVTSDLITLLGYTPETITNKDTILNPASLTRYPSSKAVADYVATHAGSGGTTNLNGYFLVTRAVNAPTYATNLGAMPTGFLKSTNIGGTASITTYSLSKNDVNLNNVPNVDATDPNNTNQDSNHRFTTDQEKSTWNGKADSFFSTYNNGICLNSISINPINGEDQTLTLGGNCVVNIVLNPVGIARKLFLRVTQGTSPYVVEFVVTGGNQVKWPGGAVPSMTPTPGAIDDYIFRVFSDSAHGMSSQNLQ